MMTNAVTFLVSRQKSDGGFSDTDSSSALDTALAVKAIQAVDSNHPSISNAINYLLSSQSANGSWHNDPLQTGFALATFAPTVLVSSANDGVPDVVKSILNVSPTTVSRGYLSGNGLSLAGVNSPILLTPAAVGSPYSYNLGASGGAAPYSYGLAGGMLPAGLSLAASGAISGTPVVSGTFNFTYRATDSQQKVVFIAAQVQVAAAPPGGTPLTWNLAVGYNLLGNGGASAIDVSAFFGDPNKYDSVWKWVTAENRWAFYTPWFSDGGEAYAKTYGYAYLSAINAGEGFWVNAYSGETVQASITGWIDSAVFRQGGIYQLWPERWSLVATGDDRTPSDFNQALSLMPPEPGVIPLNFQSLWAWSATELKWYYYAPNLEQSGGLGAYVDSHGYLHFGVNTLAPTTGFWVAANGAGGPPP
ncbi:MAG: putative Ig domain-containing protein [Burkholderiales bacterium]|nr:putative Ig domain-containing protein [Burkholderiales bacterium]